MEFGSVLVLLSWLGRFRDYTSSLSRAAHSLSFVTSGSIPDSKTVFLFYFGGKRLFMVPSFSLVLSLEKSVVFLYLSVPSKRFKP